MTDDRIDAEALYRARRIEEATDRLTSEYRADAEEPVELIELLRRLARTGTQPGRALHGQPSGAEALDGLVLYQDIADELHLLQLRLIKAAVDDGESWPLIGRALGITGDGARARWKSGRHLIEGDRKDAA